jgi:hypothetical protein
VTIYHLHLLDRQGRRVTSVELRYDSDEEAMAEVGPALQGAPGELWRGPVLVQKFLRLVREDER